MKDNGFVARVIIGGFLIMLGLSFFLKQIGFDLGFNVFNLWPLILIAFGMWFLSKGRFIGALIMIFFGVAFLTSNFLGFSIFAVFWPMIIIFIGFSILFKPHTNWNFGSDSSGSISSKDSLNESVVFWGLDEVIKSDNFRGGQVDAVFGGFKLDLRGAQISKDDAQLEVNAVFGGGEILVSKGMRVEVETAAVMGGVVNKATTANNNDQPLLKIKATAVFGAIEIKN